MGLSLHASSKLSLWSLLSLSFHVNAANGMIDLGGLNDDNFSIASGVSADGSVVVGYSSGQAWYPPSAFHWTQADGMVSLGSLSGGYTSVANAVSADGSVVVGSAGDNSSISRAFRWTQADGMVSLGSLNGLHHHSEHSSAYGVSADGSVVVGDSYDSSIGANRAFRWTQADGMVSLGTLNGSYHSFAKDVSADGSVVIGYTTDVLNDIYHAFRWTQADGMVSLGTLNGGTLSFASGVSADGSVVVGYAIDASANNSERAFRWTQASGMVSLGTLNGDYHSYAGDISADGQVVVGASRNGSSDQAFRWTSAGGMQSVEQWLTAAGVTLSPELATFRAYATNSDGSVVVGQLQNSHAFLARVSPTGSGMIDPADFNNTLAASANAHVLANAQADIVMNGLHGSPMRGLLKEDQHSAWVSGDWGRQDHSSDNADIGAGEFGYAYGVTNDLMFKLALGRSHTEQDTMHGGDSTIKGTYVVPELIATIPGTSLRTSVSGYYNRGEARIHRGYLNAGTQVTSSGSPNTRIAAIRLRLDWVDALKLGKSSLTPYTSVTYYHSRVDDYTETGGGFPVQWDSRSESSTQGRIGADGIYALNDRIDLLARLEYVHRFDSAASSASGQIIGLGAFDLPSLDYEQNWLRAGFGAEGRVGPGTASAMLNGTTEAEAPSVWVYASYKVDF